jgi:VCBS repeat-containing protein
MKTTIRPSAHAATLTLLMMFSACGGGGDSSPAPGPPPPANRAPTLTTNALTTNEDVNASTQVVAADLDGNPLTFSLSTSPQHGTATLSAAGALTYAPATNYFGTDSLGVTVSDGAGAQVTGTINITVTAVNDAPVLTSTQFSVNEDGVLTGQLTGTDVEADAFNFQYVPSASHGTATVAASGALNYSPVANYSGADQLRVRLVETSGNTAPEQLVNIDVLPLNDPPVANNDELRVTVTQGQPIVVPALTNDQDLDGNTLTPAVVTQPQRGGNVTVNATTRQLIFEAENGYAGPIEFSYRVNDGSADSNVATVRAVIGDFENLIFMSDYGTPGISELYVFDGLRVRRVSDDLPAGASVSAYSFSGDLRTLAYVVSDNTNERVYVKPLDGSAAAALRYTSPDKSVPTERRVSLNVNADGTYMMVADRWTGPTKSYFAVNTATGATTRVAGDMPGILDVRFAFFHIYEPQLLLIQAQTGGTPPHNYSNAAVTVFLGNATDARTITQIGRNYSASEYGSGEGFLYGNDARYIYYGEYLKSGSNVSHNLLRFDRQGGGEIPVLRLAFPPDRGTNGFGWSSPDYSRACIGWYESSTTTFDGPSRFYSLVLNNPTSIRAISPVVNDISQCQVASDNRTMIYRVYTPGKVSQQAYAVDSDNPGTPLLLAPAGEAGSEQSNWYTAATKMRAAILYLDNDGNPSNSGQAGRFYALPLDGSGQPFLFSDSYVYDGMSPFYAMNADGSFIAYLRPQQGSIGTLELVSTHALNYSIPLQAAGQTVGARDIRWMRRYP